MFPTGYDCKACIEDFGQRHPLRAVHAGPTIDLPTAVDAITYVCSFHDAPDPFLTIKHMDPHHAMPATPTPPNAPVIVFDAARAKLLLNSKAEAKDVPYCASVESLTAVPDRRGLTEALCLDNANKPFRAYFRGDEFAYHEDGW